MIQIKIEIKNWSSFILLVYIFKTTKEVARERERENYSLLEFRSIVYLFSYDVVVVVSVLNPTKAELGGRKVIGSFGFSISLLLLLFILPLKSLAVGSFTRANANRAAKNKQNKRGAQSKQIEEMKTIIIIIRGDFSYIYLKRVAWWLISSATCCCRSFQLNSILFYSIYLFIFQLQQQQLPKVKKFAEFVAGTKEQHSRVVQQLSLMSPLSLGPLITISTTTTTSLKASLPLATLPLRTSIIKMMMILNLTIVVL